MRMSALRRRLPAEREGGRDRAAHASRMPVNESSAVITVGLRIL